jgi:hypothetical protein
MNRQLLFALTMFALLIFPAALSAQSPHAAEGASTVAKVTFDCDWPAFTPQKFSVEVKADGSAKYSSSSPTRANEESSSADEDYQLDFKLTPATRDKIFSLAGQSDYFKGDFDYRKHAIANTGKKTLSYSDATRHAQTVFNYSDNPAIQELNRIFQGISNTLQHGRKLVFLRRFDKLGLEAELKYAEQNAESHNLAELQLIAHLLESIVDDKSILNIARQRAKRLLTQSTAQ